MEYKVVINRPKEKIEESNIDDLNALDIIRLNGYEITSYSTLEQYDEVVRKAAAKIVYSLNKSTDLLRVVSCGINNHFNQMRYTLSAPYTTAKIDVEYVLKQLAIIKIVKDFFYSERSNSFIADLNDSSRINMDDVLSIGLAELIGTMYETYIKIIARKNSDIKQLDITFVKGNELFLIHTAFDADLDNKSNLHEDKIEKLKNTIVNERINLNSVVCREMWIVSDLTKRQLYPLNNVLRIEDLMFL